MFFTNSSGLGRRLGAALSLVIASATLGACSGGDSEPATGKVGGPVSGDADTHCGNKVVTPDSGVCDGGGGVGGMAGMAMGGMAGMAMGGMAGMAMGGMGGMAMGGMAGMAMDELGATLYGQEGDDDDCKYHLRWSSTPIHRNHDVSFSLDITRKADGKPAAGASPYPEVFLDENHSAPPTKPVPSEASQGHYTVGPVRFDAAGRWTVRFHLYRDCVDGETSPHGHAAFYVDVF